MINVLRLCAGMVFYQDVVSYYVEYVREVFYLLFSFHALYVDNIIVRLRSAKLGCSMFYVYIGCVTYADDLLLISVSVLTLQSMVIICYAL